MLIEVLKSRGLFLRASGCRANPQRDWTAGAGLAIPALKAALNDPHPQVRRAAAEAIESIGE